MKQTIQFVFIIFLQINLLAQEKTTHNLIVYKKASTPVLYGLKKADNDKVVVKPIYIKIEPLESGCFKAIKQNSDKKIFYLINEEGKVTSSGYDYISEKTSSKFYEVRRKNKIGLLDSSGRELFAPIHEDIIVFKNLMIGILDSLNQKNRKWYDSRNLEEVFWCEYDEQNQFIANRNGKVGAISLEIKYDKVPAYFDTVTSIPFEYDSTVYSSKLKGRLVYKNTKVGLYDQEGILLSAKFDSIIYFVKPGNDGAEGLGKVLINNKKYWASMDGDILPDTFQLDFRYHFQDENEEGHYRAKSKAWKLSVLNKGEKVGLIDNKLKIRLKPEFDEIDFENGVSSGSTPILNFAIVKKDNKYGVINEKGNLVHDAIYDKINWYRYDTIGMAYLNKAPIKLFLSGERKIFPENSIPMGSDFYKLKNELGKYGFYELGQESSIFKLKYDEIISFGENLYVVENDDKKGVVNVHEEFVLPCIYDEINYYKYSDMYNLYKIIYLKKDGLWGIADKDGKEILPCEYVYISTVRDSDKSVMVTENKENSSSYRITLPIR